MSLLRNVLKRQFSARYLSFSIPRHQIESVPSPLPEAGQGDANKIDTKSTPGPNDVMWKSLETAAFMVTSLAMLGLAGLVYHHGYKERSLRKMSQSLDNWDPVLELATEYKTASTDVNIWVTRKEQRLIDDLVSGKTRGRYVVLIGEKGTGKTSMLLEAIKKVHGKNVVVMEAHADPEIFRIRMGKALHFEFHEDYLGSLFSIRGPRENTAILDIERGFNVLEEVALRRYKQKKGPIIFLINNAHVIRDDEVGRNLVELLQQKAETLSGSGLATLIFNSDDYWLYERLKKLGTRLDLVSISDLTRNESLKMLKGKRLQLRGEVLDDDTAHKVYELVGGRPQHLAAVAAAHKDILIACQQLIDREKQWFLNHCGLLGEEMDDDVMDTGKFAASAMALAREFVRMDAEQTPRMIDKSGDIRLPKVPLWRARQIMARPDFIQAYDNLNLFTLDSQSRVKPDSVVMLHAFREVVNMPGFDDLLQATQDRVASIESLGRTREVVLKDLVSGKGRYVFEKGKLWYEPPSEDEELDDDVYMMERSNNLHWKARMEYHQNSRDTTDISTPPNE